MVFVRDDPKNRIVYGAFCECSLHGWGFQAVLIFNVPLFEKRGVVCNFSGKNIRMINSLVNNPLIVHNIEGAILLLALCIASEAVIRRVFWLLHWGVIFMEVKVLRGLPKKSMSRLRLTGLIELQIDHAAKSKSWGMTIDGGGAKVAESLFVFGVELFRMWPN